MSRICSVIVPVYQEAGILDLFVNSLWSTLALPSQIVFVNDGSDASTGAVLRRALASAPNNAKVELLSHDGPRGSVASVNEGMERADADFIFFLDSDLILQEGWQEAMVSVLRAEPDVGAVGGVLLYPQTGGVQHCGIAFSEDVARHLYLNAQPRILPRCVYPVQAVVFALCAIPQAVRRRVGLLDTKYFNGYEDLDYQMRIAQAGYRIVVQPRATAYHWERSSGPFRALNRKRNLGRFWRLWGNTIKADLWSFLNARLVQQLETDLVDPRSRFVGIDLCVDRSDAQSLWMTIRSVQGLRLADIRDYSFRIRDPSEIWLPEVFGRDSHIGREPYLMAVENFVRLLGNRYWIDLRARYRADDVVVDLHGNVLELASLRAGCWPGGKVR